MTAITQSKLLGARLGDAVRHAKLGSAAGLVAQAADVPEALAALIAADCYAEAARVAAYALPQREAVWWACMCADHTVPTDLPAADRRARSLAEEWVRMPDESTRYAAMEWATRAGMRSPEAWAAVGAFFGGPSLSQPGLPAVPPEAHLTGRIVSDAIILASLRGDSARKDHRLLEFLTSANDISAGGPGRLAREVA